MNVEAQPLYRFYGLCLGRLYANQGLNECVSTASLLLLWSLSGPLVVTLWP